MPNSQHFSAPTGTKPSTGQPLRPPRSRYSFRHPWFENTRSDWEELTAPLLGQKLRVLEIGSFEGCSTTWMLDHLMDHPDASLVAVDTFGGGMDVAEQGPAGFDFDTVEGRFWANVQRSPQVDKLTVMKMRSEDALLELRQDNAHFDFIYIDGSHVAIDVLSDAVLAWPMLTKGGTMVFDDYDWQVFQHESHCPKVAIVSFLRCAAPNVEAVKRSGQIWVKKVAERFAPQPA